MSDVKEEPVVANGNGHGAEETPEDSSDLKKLQSAIASIESSSEISAPMKSLISSFGTYAANVSDKLDTLNSGFQMLATQLGAMTDGSRSKLADVDDKIGKICTKLNIRVARPSSTFAVPAKPTGSAASTAGSVAGSTAASATSSPAVKNFTEQVEEMAPKFPDLVLIATNKSPLSYQFEFQFRVGDIVFRSMEQALFFIKYIIMKRQDLVVRVKRAGNSGEVQQVGQIASNAEWEGVMHDVFMSLMQMKIKQCPEFEEAVKAADPNLTYVTVGPNTTLTMGCVRNATKLAALLPDKFTGKNQSGVWLKELIELYKVGLPEELPYDVNKHCKFEDVDIPADKSKVLVLADVQLSNGFQERLNTKLIVTPTMSGVDHPKDESHTVKKILQNVEGLQDYGVIVLVFGTYEVGKSPDKLEQQYTELLKYVREMSPDAVIVITNALPRNDKFSDQVKLTNYAIGIATRTLGDAKILLFDLFEKYSKVANLKNHLKPNGFHLNEAGAEKLADLLLGDLPFLNLAPPKRPQQQHNAGGGATASNRGAGSAGKGTSRGGSMTTRGGGPPAKRARRISAGMTPGMGMRGGYSSASTPRAYSGPVAATPGYSSSPWVARGSTTAAANMFGVGQMGPNSYSGYMQQQQRYDY